jgi:hypothetical protein
MKEKILKDEKCPSGFRKFPDSSPIKAKACEFDPGDRPWSVDFSPGDESATGPTGSAKAALPGYARNGV